MPGKIPDSPKRVGNPPSQTGDRSTSRAADARSDTPASLGASDSASPDQPPTSKPGSRPQDFRPRHLLPSTDDLGLPSQTTTFDELADLGGNPAGFGFMPDLSQSLAVVQKAQAWLLRADSSGAMFETAKEVVSKVARFVETHAEIAESPHASLDDKIESKRKFDAGNEALLAVTTLFTKTNLNHLHGEIARAVSQEPSPAHAAAAIAVRTIGSLKACPDPEVRAAAIFAAAGTISITLSQACTFAGSTREEISQAISDAISQFPDGQVVLNFLENKRYENLMV